MSTNVPVNIPDNNATGVNSVINVPEGLNGILKVTVDVNITHPFRGDLVIQVISPRDQITMRDQIATLSNREGGSADNFITTCLDISPYFFDSTKSPSGQWQLKVSDLAAGDVGRINSWSLHITTNPTNPTNPTKEYSSAWSKASTRR